LVSHFPNFCDDWYVAAAPLPQIEEQRGKELLNSRLLQIKKKTELS